MTDTMREQQTILGNIICTGVLKANELPAIFEARSHGVIADAIRALASRGEAINSTTVWLQCEIDAGSDFMGGPAYISALPFV